MTHWLDFVMDEILGPCLVNPDRVGKNREAAVGGQAGITEDAENGAYQETRREQQPARMVGFSDSNHVADPGMEAGGSFSQTDRNASRLRGEA